jgi:Xaa-Pro aminopeptidase
VTEVNRKNVLYELKEMMLKESVQAFLVTSASNRRYLTGYSGPGQILITQKQDYFFTNTMCLEDARKQVEDFVVYEISAGNDRLKETLDNLNITLLAFESSGVSYKEWRGFTERFLDVELKPVDGWVEHYRKIKTDAELSYMKRAQEAADTAFKQVLASIVPGASERDLCIMLENAIKRQGAFDIAFPTIVVSGYRSSLPHGEPTDKRLCPGELVTFDFGAKFNGYCSDTSRTVIMSPSEPMQEELYNIVLKAQETALSVVKAGIPAREVDFAARKVIEEAGYGKYFFHSLGHGVGLDVHEFPAVSGKSQAFLEEGMVITVEPGIYIPGTGGVRIEDMVLVTREGYKNFTGCPKNLVII